MQSTHLDFRILVWRAWVPISAPRYLGKDVKYKFWLHDTLGKKSSTRFASPTLWERILVLVSLAWHFGKKIEYLFWLPDTLGRNSSTCFGFPTFSDENLVLFWFPNTWGKKLSTYFEFTEPGFRSQISVLPRLSYLIKQVPFHMRKIIFLPFLLSGVPILTRVRQKILSSDRLQIVSFERIWWKNRASLSRSFCRAKAIVLNKRLIFCFKFYRNSLLLLKNCSL